MTLQLKVSYSKLMMVMNTVEDKKRWFRYASSVEDFPSNDYSILKCLGRRKLFSMLHYYFPLFFYFGQSSIVLGFAIELL